MDNGTIWWVLGGLLVALELATGTFYLLMLALGAAAGGLSAMLGVGTSGQLATAALVGGVFTGAWHLKRLRQAAATHASGAQDPVQSLDVGQTVNVTRWQADGSTRVSHRGSHWTARLQHPLPPGEHAPTGIYRICHLDGSVLLIEKV